MAFKDFSETLEVNVLDSNGTIVLGGYTLQKETELQYVYCQIFQLGTLAGSERIRVGVASDSAGSRVAFYSNWVNLSDIPDISADDGWIGWVRFDFGRQGLATNFQHTLVMEADNYTRVGDTFYISAVRDFPNAIYSTSANQFHESAFIANIFGFEEE